jgi:hypothetical protein
LTCPDRLSLTKQTRRALSSLAETAEKLREAIVSDSQAELPALEREMSLRVGASARALEALREHREEHGC